MPILRYSDNKNQAAVGHEDLQLSQFVRDRLAARVSYAQIVTEMVSDYGVSIGYAHSIMDSVKQAMDSPLDGERFKVLVPGGSDGDAMGYVGQVGTVSLSSDGQIGLDMDDGSQLVYSDAATFALGTEKVAKTFTIDEVRKRGRRGATVARWWVVTSNGQDYVVAGDDRGTAVGIVTGSPVGPKFKDRLDYGVTARGPYKTALAACGASKRALVVVHRGKHAWDDNTEELKKDPKRVRVMIEDALLNYQVDGTILDGDFGGGVEVAVPTGDEQDMRELLDVLGLMYSEDTSQDLITIFKVTGGRGRLDGAGWCI